MPSPNWIRTTLVGLAAGAALTVTACGGGDSARDEAIDRIVAEGLGRDVAECVVDGTVENFGEEALAEDFEAPPEDVGLTVDILDECLFGGE